MKSTKCLLAALFCLTLVTSCDNDDDTPAPVLEEEIITNVTLTFVNDANASDVVVMSNVAPDGQDGASTSQVTGAFTTGATYSLSLSLVNAEDPNAPEDVLNEDIIQEADEHFFAYAVSGINLTMTRDANDVAGPDGSKLGVNTTWVAGTASTGDVQIRLIHEPTTVDDSNEFGSVSGGSEDINITFEDVEIQ
ncbi:hypothetical protein EYD45_15260 [Hyunsoonleella flava]|uniref:Type 1 periplasmic binding fold superfamily protein n=1 Tax=Hyunsoonleella flava TaxID=2527939 RepID=A0A4Q9F9W4_9FLAO|nr:hypothetical protein [Hyunsoonleella flava]TBM99773.1 hypothetical protein EYD45_15260 [Hyunsoonleella flava]